MRNPAIDALDVLVGEWRLTLSDAWFLESRDVRQHGRATVRWLGEAFVELVADFEGDPTWHFVFGRSDPDERLIALYHDPRPTSRVFRMTFADGEWRMWREDPDFHQRFVGIHARSDRGAVRRVRGRRRYLAQGLRPDVRPGDGPVTAPTVAFRIEAS